MIGVDFAADEALEQRVRLAETLRILPDDPHGDLRILLQHVVESRTVDDEDFDFGLRDRVGGARRGFEQRHLAEEVALLQMREDVRLAVDVFDDLDLTILDDEHLGAEVALGKDHVAGRVGLRRVLDGIFSVSRFENGHVVYAATTGAVIVKLLSDVLRRTGAPMGISRLSP